MKLEGKKFKVIKAGEKKSSPYGYPSEYVVLPSAYVKQMDNGCLLCDLSYQGSDLEMHWFRTSPVISSKRLKRGYKIETLNSYYILEEIK